MGPAPLIPCSQGANLILYGPSGTGKTHWMRQKALDYTETETPPAGQTWLDDLLANYGWRAVIAAAMASLGHPVETTELSEHAWVVAKAGQHGRTPMPSTLLGYLEQHTIETSGVESTRRPPFIFSSDGNGAWTLQPVWQELDKEGADLFHLLNAAIETSSEPVRRYRFLTFYPALTYNEFVRGVRPIASGETAAAQLRLVDGVFKEICDLARENPDKRHALFIDEINRADLGAVFGGLIYLIENRATFDDSGRHVAGALIRLPDGAPDEPLFGVPANLDIFGTINTADRPGTAGAARLRGLFEFREIEPDYSVISRQAGPVCLAELLRRLNERIEYLLDRDHRLGHGFLVSVRSLEELRRAFCLRIIPLLQEYFGGDLARVALVLGSGSSGSAFISCKPVRFEKLFLGALPESVPAERFTYNVTDPKAWTEADFRALYS